MLKIAVPNKGSLAETATTMLRAAGYRQRTDPKDLTLVDSAHDVEFYYLRPRDIAVYVGEGHLDVGITGRDMLLDSVPAPRRSSPSVSVPVGSGSPRRPTGPTTSRSWRADASRPPTPGYWGAGWRNEASKQPS